ncbi:SRPBCC family protein [Streptomyces sp. NPDC020141]|uniref:SRPBCC family protein n=1 Tax=Streptomyces sp. NPDC020141 TaxID=3365065 RepID=UPI0037A5B323
MNPTDPSPDTLTTAGDGRSVLRMERRLDRPPGRVWEALTRPAPLARWFPAEVSVEPRPGGRIGFTFPGEAGPGTTGTVTDAREPALFAFTWGEDLLRFDLAPDGEGSLLTLTHTFGDRYGAASYAAGWQLCLAALARLLEDDGRPEPGAGAGAGTKSAGAGTESPGAGPERDTGGALHESYIARFGLEQGVVETTADGWRIRVERQLVRPAQTVWAELRAHSTPLLGGPAPRGFTIPESPPGRITALRPPHLLAYATAGGGEVRWQLAEGTGHGPRLILTQTGPPSTPPEPVLAAWQGRVARLAARLSAL